MSTTQDVDAATVVDREKKYLLHTWRRQAGFEPTTITRAEGCYFWDDRGERYLDFASQLVNVNAGHQHPKIIQAMKDQVDRLCYVMPNAANDQRATLAKMLVDLAPGDLSKAFIVTGGALANENALKMARAFTGRQKIISRFRSYHGATYGASSVTGDPRRRAVEPGVPGGVRVWDPFCYRCFFKMEYPQCDLYCAEAIREVIEVEGPETIAAIIVEPITGSNCRIVPPRGYLQRLRKICDDYGVLLMFDEVMTAFGRTGAWFAADHWGVAPDILTLSKGINNGALPLGAVLVTRGISDYFEEEFLYAGLTQFGNPVACAAGVAAIKVYEEERLVENSKELGVYLLQRLKHIKEKHTSVGDVRGQGLFAGIELVKDKETREPLIPWTVECYENRHPLAEQLLARLKDEGLHTYMRWNVLMICPPLCITKAELTWGLERIDDALQLVDERIAWQ
jgi:taurine--2-oxoglutarate transaminase